MPPDELLFKHKEKHTMIPGNVQEALDKVLQLAKDEIEHLREDALHDPGSTNDYIDSKIALGRVRAYFDREKTS